MLHQPGSSLQDYIRRLPPYAEFFIVVFVCFGGPIIVSLWYLSEPSWAEQTDWYDDLSIVTMVITEVVSLFAVALFLSIRGWSRRDFGFRISWLSTLCGLLLAGGIQLATAIVLVIAGGLVADPSVFEGRGTEWYASLALTALFLPLNSVFEEVIVVGYVMAFLVRHQSLAIAIVASTTIRVLYHLYQGMSAILTIAPMGVLACLVYWRWKNLWPLIVAHTFLNIWHLWFQWSGS